MPSNLINSHFSVLMNRYFFYGVGVMAINREKGVV